MPEIFWKIGGRAKMRETKEIIQRITEDKPLGRAIWIPDHIESLLT